MIAFQDSIIYDLIKIEPIKDGGGLHVKTAAKLEKTRQPISIDIARSDSVTPHSILKHYSTIVENEKINIKPTHMKQY